jgi:hypothetical protein
MNDKELQKNFFTFVEIQKTTLDTHQFSKSISASLQPTYSAL